MNGVMNELSTIECPHFDICSGCTLNGSVTHPPIWNEIESFFLHLSPELNPRLNVGSVRNWRTRAKLAVRGSSQNPTIGLFRKKSHDAFAIPFCQVHHPAINRAVLILSEAIREAKIAPFDEKKGLLRYAQFFVSLQTGQVSLSLVWNGRECVKEMDLLKERLLLKGPWHSIWHNFQPLITNRIFGDEWLCAFGESFIQQKLNGIEISFHPGAFSQAHWTLFEKLAHQVGKWVPNGARLLEIYSGVGALGLLASHRTARVDLVESNPFARLSFEAMTSHENVHFHSLEAKDALHLLRKSDTIIVDPPRKGLDAVLLKALTKTSGRLIYVSCDFQSFRRDALELPRYGWVLKEAEGFLLFPGTDHVEIASLFERTKTF